MCVLGTTVGYAKTAEPIEMPFGEACMSCVRRIKQPSDGVEVPGRTDNFEGDAWGWIKITSPTNKRALHSATCN